MKRDLRDSWRIFIRHLLKYEDIRKLLKYKKAATFFKNASTSYPMTASYILCIPHHFSRPFAICQPIYWFLIWNFKFGVEEPVRPDFEIPLIIICVVPNFIYQSTKNVKIRRRKI